VKPFGFWKLPKVSYKLYRRVVLWFGGDYTQEEAWVILKGLGRIYSGPGENMVSLGPKHCSMTIIASTIGETNYVGLLKTIEYKVKHAIFYLEKTV